MWIGVEETIEQHFLDDHPGSVGRNDLAIMSRGIDGLHLVDLDPLYVLHHQKPLSRVIPVHFGNVDPWLIGEIAAKAIRVASLGYVIQFSIQRVSEVLGNFLKVVHIAEGRMSLGVFSKVVDDLKIGMQRSQDVRTLYFQRDTLVRGQSREMNLREGGKQAGAC